MLYYQNMYKILKTMKEKKEHFNLNLIFHFFNFHFFGRVTLSRSSFIQQTFFYKKTSPFFLSFSTWYIFLTTFYSRQNLFFVLKKTNKTPVFSIFLFYSKWNTILLRERNGMKNYFFVFFSEIVNTFFFVLTRVKFFRILMKS